MMILERLLAAVSVLLLIGCMLAPLKKTAFAQRNPWVKKIVGFHTLYGLVLLAAAFVHGILAGNKPGMMTGKLAWMILLILILLTLFRNKMKTRSWNRIHSGLAAVVCFLVVIHIVYAIVV